jgi:hypothetical protein
MASSRSRAAEYADKLGLRAEYWLLLGNQMNRACRRRTIVKVNDWYQAG